MASEKYYIVWEGHHPGVYESWQQCRAETQHYAGAKYKSFKGITREEAQELLERGSEAAMAKNQQREPYICNTHVDRSALSVDASTIGNPGPMEYRGVWVESGDVLFSSKVYPKGTNNIGEFLAIVHAMAWMKQHNYIVPIYSDSLTAISWIRKGRANTKLPHTSETVELLQVLSRAERWLLTNNLSMYQLLKWNTEEWGEIPADYGRK